MSEHRGRRIMKENDYYPETRKKYKSTYNGKTDEKFSEYIVKQNFTTSEKQVWMGDITYIKATISGVYLAVVIDLYNREVFGFSISKKIDK